VAVQFMDIAKKVSVPCLVLDLCLMELQSGHQLMGLADF